MKEGDIILFGGIQYKVSGIQTDANGNAIYCYDKV